MEQLEDDDPKNRELAYDVARTVSLTEAGVDVNPAFACGNDRRRLAGPKRLRELLESSTEPRHGAGPARARRPSEYVDRGTPRRSTFRRSTPKAIRSPRQDPHAHACSLQARELQSGPPEPTSSSSRPTDCLKNSRNAWIAVIWSASNPSLSRRSGLARPRIG